jgi:pSer/pThr/pTyr-binding forkhead associated (FHA) protein
VADLGSTNGTFVGRTRMTSPMTLQDDDRITIASVEVRLRFMGVGGRAKDPAHPSQAP